MTVTIGRIVHYTLSQADADQVNRRRVTTRMVAGATRRGQWLEGAQAHVGLFATAGMVQPMIVVGLIVDEPTRVSGQVFLDGTDVLWVQADEGVGEGCWAWPARVGD